MSITYDVLKDDVRAGSPIDFGFVTYVPERTCRVEEDTKRASQTQLVVTKSCSECGHCFGAETHYERMFEGMVLNEIELPRYCPNCGARVIEEASDDADR